MKLQLNRALHLLKSICLVTLILCLGVTRLQAVFQECFVTAYKGTATTTDVVPCPDPNNGSVPGGSCGVNVSVFGSITSSSCSPVPVIPAAARRIIYGSVADSTTRWAVTPGEHTYDGTTAGISQFHSLSNVPGVYKMYITRGAGTTTHSTNLVMSVTVSGTSTLADTNGAGHTSLTVPFGRIGVNNATDTWIFIGYLTNTEPSPTATFAYLSGAVDGIDNRWIMDAVRFQSLDCCIFVSQVDPLGPLSAGQNFVNVTGVTIGATNITVYANGFLIGQTNYLPGFSSGTITVATTALVKDDQLTAQQAKNGSFSIVPGSGPMVGGGANPKIKTFLSCYKNASLTGPIGSNGAISGNPYIVKATNFVAGFNTAPRGGVELLPGSFWQTATFSISTDPALDMNSGGTVTDTNPFCALDGLGFSIDDTDSGPYDIYVDQIMNGNTVVEDFENYSGGEIKTFIAPNLAGIYGPASQFLSSPNSSVVSTYHAFSGTKSCRIQFQWINNSNSRWAHVVASGGSGGKIYPQLNTTQPVTIRYLLLPAETNFPPDLAYSWSPPLLTLSWTSGVLQSATAMTTNSFADIPNATSPLIVNLSTGSITKFYRLRGQ